MHTIVFVLGMWLGVFITSFVVYGARHSEEQHKQQEQDPCNDQNSAPKTKQAVWT